MAPCSRCPSPAVTHIRYSGQHLCKEHFLRFFEERAKAELTAQGRLPRGRIAVALSGGKDSVSLLHFLHGVTQDRPDVKLVAVSVDEGISGYRDGALTICKDLTQRLDVPWHVVRTEDLAGYTIDAYAAGTSGPSGTAAKRLKVAPPAAPGQAAGPGPDADPGPRGGQGAQPPSEGAPAAARQGRPACGPCGVFRRLGINTVARELGAAAVATGHNLDDTAQTVLMNVLGGDPERLARLAPHKEAKPGLVPRIMPFRRIPEKEVLLYALLHGLPIHDEMECPYAARAHRFAMRDLLLDLERKKPGTRHSLLRFHDRVKPALVAGSDLPEATPCPDCGEPTSGDLCRACLWRS